MQKNEVTGAARCVDAPRPQTPPTRPTVPTTPPTTPTQQPTPPRQQQSRIQCSSSLDRSLMVIQESIPGQTQPKTWDSKPATLFCDSNYPSALSRATCPPDRNSVKLVVTPEKNCASGEECKNNQCVKKASIAPVGERCSYSLNNRGVCQYNPNLKGTYYECVATCSQEGRTTRSFSLGKTCVWSNLFEYPVALTKCNSGSRVN